MNTTPQPYAQAFFTDKPKVTLAHLSMDIELAFQSTGKIVGTSNQMS
jgi:hypothetical protein